MKPPLLLLLLLLLNPLSADVIIITPAGPPVFSAPVIQQPYLVLCISVTTGDLTEVIVPAYSIPSAMSAASAMLGWRWMPLMAWEVGK